MEPSRGFSEGFKDIAQQDMMLNQQNMHIMPPNNNPMESGLDGPYWSQLFGSQQTLDPHTSFNMNHNTIIIDEPTWEEREADSSLYCVCRGRDDGSFMICCESCENWFHGVCVGIREKDGPNVDAYYCQKCDAAGKGKTAWKIITKKRSLSVAIDDDGLYLPKKLKRTPEEEAVYLKEKAEKQRKLEEEMRKRREESLAKRQREEAERLRLKAELQKQSVEAMQKRRDHFKELFVKSIGEGCRFDIESNENSEEALQKLKDQNNHIQKSAMIEEALYNLHKELNTDHARHFRNLVFNLKDKKNSSLRKRIIDGELSAFDLVRLDPQDLANQDIIKLREEQDKAALQSVYKIKEIDNTVQPAHLLSGILPTVEAIEADSPLLSTSGSLRTSGPLRSTFEDNIDLTSPAKPAIIAESPVKRVDLSDVQINLDGFDNVNVGIDDSKEIETGYMEEQESFSLSPAHSPKRSSSIPQKESSWLGILEYKYKDFDIQFPCTCHPINGPSVEEYLPRVLKITNRMTRDQLLQYLPKIDFSATRNRTCVYFDVEEQYQRDYKFI